MRAQAVLVWVAGPLLLAAGRAGGQEKADRDPLRDALAAQEKRLWEALRKGDNEALRELLPPEYRETGGPAEGRLNRADAVKRWGELRVSDSALDDFAAVGLGKDAAVLTYRARVKGNLGGQAAADLEYFVSSAWAKREDKWLCASRQWTPVAKVEPRPVVEMFELELARDRLRCAYKGATALQDVRPELSLTFRDGGNLSQDLGYWGSWQPGEVKEVPLNFLAVGVEQIERADLGGRATLDGKSVSLSAVARRQK